MKIKIWFIILVIIFMIGSETAETASVDRTETVGATGTILFSPGPLLDDFRYAANVNVWRVKTGTFKSDAPQDGVCNDSYTDDSGIVFGGTGNSLQLDYNVSKNESFAGYYSNLGGTGLGAYKSVSFWVKGVSGGEFFKVELKNNSGDADRNHAAVYITDYLDGGVTTVWKKVTIPFHNFANINDWSQVKELVVTFENVQSVVNGSPTQGTIYIDNIEFSNNPVDVVRIDHYGDKLGTNALGGNMGDMDSSPPAKVYSFSTTEYYNAPNSLLSEYDVTYGWSGIYVIFGGGDNGWIEIPHDFSEYTNLTLRVKAKSVAENPKVLKIELVDGSGSAAAVRITGITDSWQRWTIPLNVFYPSGLDKSTLKKMSFIYEDWKIGQEGGNKVGALYIEDVQFE